MKTIKVLIVCSGNICRSPMVAAYLRQRLADSGLSHVVVASAGTLGIAGAPASVLATAAMADIDIDLRDHRSRALSEADLKTSEIVLVMDHGHLEFIAARYPDGRDQRYLLRAFERGPEPSSEAPDLDDPIGSDLDVFREQRETIRVCVDHFVLHLRNAESPS